MTKVQIDNADRIAYNSDYNHSGNDGDEAGGGRRGDRWRRWRREAVIDSGNGGGRDAERRRDGRWTGLSE